MMKLEYVAGRAEVSSERIQKYAKIKGMKFIDIDGQIWITNDDVETIYSVGPNNLIKIKKNP